MPKVELRGDPLHISWENSDIIALPLVVVECGRLLRRPPFDRQSAAPHGAGIFVSDEGSLSHNSTARPDANKQIARAPTAKIFIIIDQDR